MRKKPVESDESKEIGGFNPERPRRPKSPQVGPAPTDDPDRRAPADLKRKIEKKAPRREDEHGND